MIHPTGHHPDRRQEGWHEQAARGQVGLNTLLLSDWMLGSVCAEQESRRAREAAAEASCYEEFGGERGREGTIEGGYHRRVDRDQAQDRPHQDDFGAYTPPSLRLVVSTTTFSHPAYPPTSPSHLPTTYHPLPRLFHPATTSSFVQGISSKSPNGGREERLKGRSARKTFQDFASSASSAERPLLLVRPFAELSISVELLRRDSAQAQTYHRSPSRSAKLCTTPSPLILSLLAPSTTLAASVATRAAASPSSAELGAMGAGVVPLSFASESGPHRMSGVAELAARESAPRVVRADMSWGKGGQW